MRHPRVVHLIFAVAGYGVLAGLAALWIEFGCPRGLGELFHAEDKLLTYGLGVGCGLGIAALSWLIVLIIPSAKVLEEEFGYLLGSQRVGEIFVLAAASGIAEELLFRGALQQMVGPYLATAIFALAHPPFTRRLRMWPFFALVAGAVFAIQVEVTGSILGAILTHFIINLVNLLRISAKYGALEE